MATSNSTLTTEWSEVCNNINNFLLSLVNPGDIIEVATTEDGADPVAIYGHRLEYSLLGESRDSISRLAIGPGYVFAKASSPASLSIVISAWDDSLLLFGGLWDTSASWLIDRIWG